MTITKRSIILISISSVLAGIGQIMWKKASDNISLSEILTFIDPFFISGVLIYLTATFCMVLAFKEGDLSVLHPFLATSYVWVTLITPLIFPTETITILKIFGVFLIFLGVYSIGVGGKKGG
jgi:drug/metabolite transporter (DMT)-like permease